MRLFLLQMLPKNIMTWSTSDYIGGGALSLLITFGFGVVIFLKRQLSLKQEVIKENNLRVIKTLEVLISETGKIKLVLDNINRTTLEQREVENKYTRLEIKNEFMSKVTDQNNKLKELTLSVQNLKEILIKMSAKNDY